MNLLKSKRKGKLLIYDEVFETMSLSDYKLLFGNFYPLHIETNRYMYYIAYYGISEHFDIVRDGEMNPQYTMEILDGKIKFSKFEV